MKKFRVQKSDLMKDNTLIKEDGFISNGSFAIKENFIIVNKSCNANLLTLKEMAKQLNCTLHPNWKTLKDVVNFYLNDNYNIKVEYAHENNLFTTLIIGENQDIKIDKQIINRVFNIDSDIILYSDGNRFHPLKIMLNNNFIGIISPCC